jgi:hypothetical protein
MQALWHDGNTVGQFARLLHKQLAIIGGVRYQLTA